MSCTARVGFEPGTTPGHSDAGGDGTAQLDAGPFGDGAPRLDVGPTGDGATRLDVGPIGDGVFGDPFMSITLTVDPVYPLYGGNWNDYVKNYNGGTSVYDQPDAPCLGAETGGYDACIHGGERRRVRVTGRSSCAGLTITDALGVFDWTCRIDGGVATFFSIGVKRGRGLRDLVDATAWKLSSVTVKDGSVPLGVSDSTAWWTNPVVQLPDNHLPADIAIVLDGVADGGNDQVYLPGTIFTLASSAATSGYNLNLDKLALVTLPGATLTYNGQGDRTCDTDTGELNTGGNWPCLISVGSQKFVWLEADLSDTTPNALVAVVQLAHMSFSRLNNIRAAGGQYNSGYLIGSSSNLITDYVGHDFDGLDYPFAIISGSSFNRIHGLRLSHATSMASRSVLYVAQNTSNVLTGVEIDNSGGNPALFIDDVSNTTIAGLQITSSAGRGIYAFGVLGPIVGTTLSHASVLASGYGAIELESAGGAVYGTTFNQVLAAGDGGGYGLVSGFGTGHTTMSQMVLANPMVTTLGSHAVDTQRLTNAILVGTAPSTCQVSGGADPGYAEDCTNTGASDATWVTGPSVDVSESFVGKVTTADTKNASNIGGSSPYVGVTDWVTFENPYRRWGLEGGEFVSVASVIWPPPLVDAKMAYDSARQVIWLYGGDRMTTAVEYRPGDVSAELWRWDGALWSRVCTACAPGSRRGHGLAYDRVRDRLVLFGGAHDSTAMYTNDVWEWDGLTWTERTDIIGAAPSARHGVYMDYARDRSRVVIFAGSTAGGDVADVYEYDGSRWYGPFQPAGAPTARSDDGQGAAYDPVRGRLLLYGGALSDLVMWAWDGALWTSVVLGCRDAVYSSNTLVYDEARDDLVMFEGYQQADVRAVTIFDSASGTCLQTIGPPARDGTAAAYDAYHGEVVLFGGNSCGAGCNFDDTFRYSPVSATGPVLNPSACSARICRIYDWRLKASDTVIRNKSGDGVSVNEPFVAGAFCPAAVHGNRALTDQQTPAHTFLVNAIEIAGDDIGNDNGLCESNEACIYSPNFGYYQGEGDFRANGTCLFVDGLVSGVTLYAYPTNGG